MAISGLNIRRILLKNNTRVFSARELGELLSLSPRQSLYYLEKGLKESLFYQLKRGLYSLRSDPPSELEIANRLYRPSYVSFEYALAYYNLIPEMVYKVTSATTKTTREFVTDDKTYSYSTIKPVAYTGYELKVIDEKRFLMAEAEKAAVDYLYLVSLNKRAWLERLDLSSVNKNKVKFYAGLFGKKSLDKLIKKYA